MKYCVRLCVAARVSVFTRVRRAVLEKISVENPQNDDGIKPKKNTDKMEPEKNKNLK